MSERLFTDKRDFGRLDVLGVWSLDSATPATSAYRAHASGSPNGTFEEFLEFARDWAVCHGAGK